MKAGTGVLVGILSFIGGGAAGFFGANLFFKQKYEQKAEEEIASVRKAFAEASHVTKDAKDKKVTVEQAQSVAVKYVPDDQKKDVLNMILNASSSQPKQITVDDYGEKAGFQKAELRYFHNGVLATRDGKTKISDADIESVIGKDWKSWIDGEDEIYIRNEDQKIDVAIYSDLSDFK